MNYLYLFVLASALAATATSASAQSSDRYGSGQSYGFRYNTVAVPDVLADTQIRADGRAFGRAAGVRHRIPVIPPSKVIIVDNRTGDLWAWSEAEQTVLYLGYIFPLAGQGPFARVINVPEQR